MGMTIRDRIKELRRVRAGDLQPHPRNWRTHPDTQRDALRGVLAEVGYADALLVRELPDGCLQLIDGHLRAETTPDAEVPVLVLDVDEQEAAKLLALLDPLAGMAETDAAVLAELVADVDTDNAALQEILDRVLADAELPVAEESAGEPREVDVPEVFQVVIECDGEQQQRAVYERLAAEGHKCKLLTL
jgi:hypothetical protein